jgi:hypothetical protein
MVATAGCGQADPSGDGADATAGGSGDAIGPSPVTEAGLGEWACPAGELPLEDGSCLEAGVPPGECGVGMAATGDGSCSPILPDAPCADGEMALPGEAACRPVAPCADGNWGDIPVDSSTQFVDSAYTAGGSDGSAAKPWLSVQAGIDAAVDGGSVAIAAGTYAEPLLVQDKRVRLWGRCPALVRIATVDQMALRLEQGSDGSEVHDLAFSAAGHIAVHVGGALDVSVDRVWIQGAGIIGIDVEGGEPRASVTRSLIEDSGGIGVFGYGAELVVEDTVVRDIAHLSDGDFGNGIRVFAGEGGATELTVRRSVVSGTWGAGIYGRGSNVHVSDVVIFDVAPEPATESDGVGIGVYPLERLPSALDVTGTHVARTHLAGILVTGSSGDIRSTVVRDVAPPGALDTSVGILGGGGLDLPPTTLRVRSVTVEQTRVYGIAVSDADGVVEAALVRDTEPLPSLNGGVDVGGRGMGVETLVASSVRPKLTVAGSRIERTHEFAMTALGGDLTVDSTRISDVAFRTTDKLFGRGIHVQFEPATGSSSVAVVRRSLVERAHDHGIMVYDSDATIESTWVRDTSKNVEAGLPHGQALGRGIAVQGRLLREQEATATIDQVLVEGSHEAGILLLGARVQLRRSVVRGTLPGIQGALGDGIIVAGIPSMVDPSRYYPSTLELESSLVQDNSRAGIANFAAVVHMSGTDLSCNPIDLNGERYDELDFAFDFGDEGGNTCGCGAEVRPCTAASAGLQPPGVTLN